MLWQLLKVFSLKFLILQECGTNVKLLDLQATFLKKNNETIKNKQKYITSKNTNDLIL